MNSPFRKSPLPLIERQVHRWDRIAEALRHRLGATPSVEVIYRPVITLSGSSGTGRQQLAETLAGELHYEIFGRELVERVAHDLELNRPLVEGMDERVDSEIRVLFSSWMHGHEIESTDYIRAMARAILGLARSGGVIITGRGGAFILEKTVDCVGAAVRLVAPLERRIERLMAQQHLSEKEARQLIEKSDREQADFIRHYFHREITDPLAYDLVINTGKYDIEQAAHLVRQTLQMRGYNLERIAQGF